jgi:hypothetical protein
MRLRPGGVGPECLQAVSQLFRSSEARTMTAVALVGFDAQAVTHDAALGRAAGQESEGRAAGITLAVWAAVTNACGPVVAWKTAYAYAT